MGSLSFSSPHIVAMVGVPGAGKSQFAEQFATTFSTPFINYHQLGYFGDNKLLDKAVIKLLLEVMKTKKTIIIEGLTDKLEERSDLTKLARKHGYKVVFAWVQTDHEVAMKRALKYQSVEQYNDRIQRFFPPQENEQQIVISGRHTYNTQARTLLTHLAEQANPKASMAIDKSTPAPQPTTQDNSSGQIPVTSLRSNPTRQRASRI